jgi:hypothetical protein
MNDVCGFVGGFVGGREVEGGNGEWEEMGAMCGGMRNERWGALERNESRLESSRRKEGRGGRVCR